MFNSALKEEIATLKERVKYVEEQRERALNSCASKTDALSDVTKEKESLEALLKSVVQERDSLQETVTLVYMENEAALVHHFAFTESQQVIEKIVEKEVIKEVIKEVEVPAIPSNAKEIHKRNLKLFKEALNGSNVGKVLVMEKGKLKTLEFSGISEGKEIVKRAEKGEILFA